MQIAKRPPNKEIILYYIFQEGGGPTLPPCGCPCLNYVNIHMCFLKRKRKCTPRRTKLHNKQTFSGVCSNTPKYSAQYYKIYNYINKMNIFTIFFWTKLQQSILQNTPNCSIFKNFLGGTCPRTPLPNARPDTF